MIGLVHLQHWNRWFVSMSMFIERQNMCSFIFMLFSIVLWISNTFVSQKSFWPRGRVVGGTSILNYLVYNRGSRHDFDGWAHNGCEGWSYQEVLPYFLKSEDNIIPEVMDSSNIHYAILIFWIMEYLLW